MGNKEQDPSGSTWVDHIPVIWFEPQVDRPKRQLIIFLSNLSGTKESTIPFLQDLAMQGFVALSFDAYQHGESGNESKEEITKRVFGNFRRNMWPILGQTALDTLKVIDWAVSSLKVEPHVYIGRLSMGGDIAIVAAGIDYRIKRVAAVVATPDWLRTGIEDAFHPSVVLPPGKPDHYSKYFYDHMNSLTHIKHYSHGPTIHFLCGQDDTHVPPEAAFRFQSALSDYYPDSASKVTFNLIPKLKHMDVREEKLWWPDCLEWLTNDQ